jgi:serine protease Do
MFKTFLSSGIVLMLCASMSLAQTKLPAGAERSEYWLGIWCSNVPPELRLHLNLPKQGILVEGVAKDSPAEKAGIARFDVLLRADEKALVEPRDVMSAVEASKGGKMKIEIVREGKPKTIEVAPAKRPEKTDAAEGQPGIADMQTVEKWMQSISPGHGGEGNRQQMRFRMLHPGAIVPKDVAPLAKLPANLSISVSKEGDQPAKIVVKRGDDKWELTDKDLDKLPADIRPHVERMLGLGPLGAVINGEGTISFAPEMPEHPDAAAWQERLEKRMNDMNARMDKMMKRMEEVFEGRGHSTVPEKPAEQK